MALVDATASVSGGGVYLRNLLAYWSKSPIPLWAEVLHAPEFDLRGIDTEQRKVLFRKVWIPGIAGRVWLIGSVYKLVWRQLILPLHLWRRRPAVFFSNSGMLPALIPRKVRTIVAIHNSMPLQPELWNLERSRLAKLRLWLLRRQILRLCRAGVEMVVFSEDLKDRLQQLGARDDRCTVIRHGIEWGEPERRLEFPSDLPGARLAGRHFLLYVSQLHRYKNVLNLISAFASLRKSRPDVDLLIVGHLTDHGYAQEIHEAIESAGLAGAVRIIPGADRQSLIGLYRTAAAVVYPSRAENCPFVLLEAMALGRPIAASDIPAIVETCGDAAIYFHPDDPVAMSQQMARLLLDAELRDLLSSNGIRRAATLSWPVAARRTLDLILRLAAETSSV